VLIGKWPCYRELTKEKTEGYIRSKEEREFQVHSRSRVVRKPRRKLARRSGSEFISRGNNPSKFTIRNKKIVYAAIEIGLPITRCHALIGVSSLIFNGWLEYGKDPRYRRFYHFRNKIKKIERERELEALNVIRSCGKGGIKMTKTKVRIGPKGNEVERVTSTLAPQWTAAAWFLERTIKDIYGKDVPIFTKTPQEYARDIQEASEILLNSVPLGEGEDE